MKKRLLSTFLCLCMALTLLPAPARAAEGATISVDGTSKTLAAAISEANAGDTLQLTASFTQPRNNGVTISKDLTLDLNGQTITYNGLNSSLITVSGCTLTVTDSGTDGAIEAMEANYVFYLEELGKLIVNGGTLSSPNGSSLIWNASNGKITINGGTVSASGRSYGTIFSGSGSRGTIAVTGGTVQATGEDGRAIGSDSGAVTVSGGTVEATGNNGKAIDKSSTTGTITVSGGIVRATTGPAIYQRSYGPIVIKGGTVTSANTGAKSGTIYFATAPRNPQTMLTITDGTVENTASPDEGYSVYFGRDPYMGGEVTSETLYGYYSHTGGAVGKVYPEPPPHTHAVSVDCSASEGTQVTFTALGDTATLTAGSYYLDADKELTAPLTVPDGATVDLCLNGHALKYVGTNDAHSVITVGDGATLNLCDCDGSGGSHTFTSPVTNEDVTISGGLITGAHRVATQPETAGGAIYSKGDVNLYGGTVAGNKGYVGGGVHLNGKDKTTDLTFTMYGGQICHNESTYSGGGVYLYPCAADPANAGFVLHGGEIHHNKTNNAGGGVIASGTRTSILMDGGSIHHNTAGGRGGGLYSYASTTSLLGGSIHHNTTESDEAGGIYPSSSSGAVVTLGGDMTITDNTAAGGAASNLFALYQMTVQDGFTGQVGIHTRDDDYYFGRPYFRGPEGASLERKLGQFLPDVPGQCAELLTGENAGKLTLSRIAITTQPTAEAPAVGVNYAPEGISYQWYTAQRRDEAVTDRNAAPYEDIHPTSARSSRPIASFDETSGTWTSSQYRQGENGGYFVIGMKAGDALTVTIPADQMPQMPEGQTWALVLEGDDSLAACFDPSETNSEGVTVTIGADGAVTVTYPVPADDEYALMAYDLFYHDEEDNYVGLSTPVISAVWTHIVPVDAVTGQTAATLSAPAPGDYLCQVAWPDGTVLNSNPVTFAPPVTHTHAVSVGCETEGENLVTFKALTSQDGALYIDGKAAKEANRYYELPAGHYYLAEDVRLNKFIYALPGDAAALTFDLCLNGYKLECADASSVIYIAANKPFNLCDCNPTGEDRTGNVIENPVSGYTEVIWGGVITGGTRAAIEQPLNASVTLYGGTIAGNNSSSVYGGGVHANHLVMHGGAIMYNKAGKGGGVYAIKSFTMTGGEISHNWADTEGGVKLGDSATATLSGNAVISDNEAGTGTAKAPSNLCLGTGRTVTVTPGGLGQNARVGVTTAAPTDASPVTVAVAGEGDALTADDLAKFSSDNSDYELKLSEGSIVLAKPEPYAITTQPTVANGYTVTASHPDKAHYQWYRSNDRAGIGAKITQEGTAFGSAAEGADYEGSNGHWTGTVKNGVCEFFTLNLKAGQLIYLDISDACKGKPFTLTGDNGKTVTATPTTGTLYLPVPADGSYTLRISGLISTSALLFSASLYPPLAGQTGAALVPAKGGSHFCLVTWDGTDQYERSDSVTPVIATTALTLEPETLALQVGQTEYLNATRTPSDANDDITWASDNEEVATVDDWGEVEAVSVGTATITATANGITASCAVTVTPVPAITQQPTAENKYTVGVNYAPEGISYQWYPATVTTADITPENADPFTEDGDPANFADGKWTVAEGDWYDGYFTTALKKGDVVAVTMTTAEKPDEGALGLIYENYDHGESYHLGYYFSDFEPDEGVTAAEKDGSTVITYVIPADGSYDLVLVGPYGGDVAISAKLTHTQLGEAVSGQTTAQLTATQVGNYLCRVTWPDGTILDSNVVAYVPLDPGESKGEVEVKGDTPPVTVDEDALKDLAGEVSNGDTVTVKLTVEKQDSPADKDKLEAIISGKKNDVLYLDLSLLKQVNDGTPQPITDTEGKVLEIAVDYDFTGKKDVTVYRKHGEEQAAALTRLTARPTENYTEGSFFADSANGKVYIYAGKFSTYAIGYTARSTTPSRPSRPSRPAWPFTDVKTTDDCYEAVKYVYERGWMLGTSDTTFDPNGPLTRAMLATVLYRSAGSPKVEGAPEFRDTEAETWYSDAVRWAVEAKILRGYGNGSFGPNDPVSKEMLNMVMGRLQGQDPAWVGDNALAVPATRAEIAAMLMRYCQGEQ